MQTILYREYHPIEEGKFHFEALLKHLDRFGAPKLVSVGEDATRVISRVDYDIVFFHVMRMGYHALHPLKQILLRVFNRYFIMVN